MQKVELSNLAPEVACIQDYPSYSTETKKTKLYVAGRSSWNLNWGTTSEYYLLGLFRYTPYTLQHQRSTVLLLTQSKRQNPTNSLSWCRWVWRRNCFVRVLPLLRCLWVTLHWTSRGRASSLCLATFGSLPLRSLLFRGRRCDVRCCTIQQCLWWLLEPIYVLSRRHLQYLYSSRNHLMEGKRGQRHLLRRLVLCHLCCLCSGSRRGLPSTTHSLRLCLSPSLVESLLLKNSQIRCHQAKNRWLA